MSADISKEMVLTVLYRAIDEVNEMLPTERQVDKAPSTVLFGADARMDSLALVNFVLAADGQLTEKWGTSITVADRLLNIGSPVTSITVESLANLVVQLLQEQSDDR